MYYNDAFVLNHVVCSLVSRTTMEWELLVSTHQNGLLQTTLLYLLGKG